MLTTWKRLRYKTFRLANTSLPWVFIRFIRKNHEYTEYRMYYCKIIKGSYIVWRGKVWLLRKINRKKEKDHTMIILYHVCSFPEAWWFWLYEWGAPHTFSFLSKSSHVGCPDDFYVMDHVVVFVPLTAPRFPLHLVSLLSGLTLSSFDIFYNFDHRDDGEG